MLSTCVVLGGIWVLVAYYINFLKGNDSVSYMQHELWLGFPMPYRVASAVIQVLSAIAFLVTVVLLLVHPPTQGILQDSLLVTPLLMLGFLAASGVWAFANIDQRPLSFASLFVGSVCCIVLLAGLAEDDMSAQPAVSTIKVFAWALLCVTTVLLDGVAYSGRLLRGTRT